jgi:hypothetical protein
MGGGSARAFEATLNPRRPTGSAALSTCCCVGAVAIRATVGAAKARPDRPEGFASAVGGYADFLPVLGLVARRRTHSAPFGPLRSNRRRQVSPRSALRARATSPALLSADEAPSGLPERAFAEALVVAVGKARAVKPDVRRGPTVSALADVQTDVQGARFVHVSQVHWCTSARRGCTTYEIARDRPPGLTESSCLGQPLSTGNAQTVSNHARTQRIHGLCTSRFR